METDSSSSPCRHVLEEYLNDYKNDCDGEHGLRFIAALLREYSAKFNAVEKICRTLPRHNPALKMSKEAEEIERK